MMMAAFSLSIHMYMWPASLGFTPRADTDKEGPRTLQYSFQSPAVSGDVRLFSADVQAIERAT